MKQNIAAEMHIDVINKTVETDMNIITNNQIRNRKQTTPLNKRKIKVKKFRR